MRTSQVENRGLKYHLKKLALPSGSAARTIQAGALAGVTMDLDFAHDTQRWLGLQERELNGWLRRLSKGIQTGVDVGANDGTYTLYFLKKTSAQKVIAFEPATECIERLEKNLQLNHLGNDPRLRLVPHPAGQETNGTDVALDSCMGDIKFPCLVKVDIDGGEGSLLRGAKQLLASHRVRWIIEVHSPALQDECMGILKEANYRVHIVRNAWWRHFLPELRPGELNHWVVATQTDDF